MKRRIAYVAAGFLVFGCGARTGATAATPSGTNPPATNAPAASTARPAPAGLTSKQGRLLPETIQQVVRTNLPSMKKCYDEGVKRVPTLRGTVTTKFVIGLDGLVQSAEATTDASHPAFPDAKVEACVLKTFTALVFPKPEGGTVTVTYPLVFTPEDRE